MIKSKYNWNLNNPTEYISDSIAQRLKLSPIIKKILESKNIIEEEDIQRTLNGVDINHDSSLLSDIDKAIERINQAIDKNERILVYGDYDADGVLSLIHI